MVSSSSSASHEYEGTVSLEDSWMKISVVSEMWRSLGSLPVRGSFSARMPKSSFARVRRVLVPDKMKMIRRMKWKMREKMESKE